MLKKMLFISIILFSVVVFSQENSSEININDSKFSIAATVGPTYKFGKRAKSYPSFLNDYIENKNFGLCYEFDVMYDVNDKSSYGIKINNFKAGSNSNNLNILFIGASYTAYTRTLDPNNSSCLNFAFGYIGMTNTVNENVNFVVKGNSLGMDVNYSYYFGLGPKFQIGPKISVLGGALTKVTIEYANGISENYKFNGDYESLFSLNLSCSARYRF